MHEVELKFQVPAAAREAVLRAVGTASARQTRLQARYVDSADRHLARARAALRLRREGNRWVQTLKAEGNHPMQRLEHEVDLGPVRGVPALDLRRHADTPAALALARALGLAPADCARRIAAGDDLGLAVCFETDVRRTHREVRVAGGRVELAFDQGHLRAGGRTLALCELELELCAGTPEVLLALARRWVLRHGLWLDARSKAERGDLLARGKWAAPPTHATPVVLAGAMRPADALQAMLRSGLAQVLANASVLADEVVVARLTDALRAEHLHQWRVGLRRLRSALQVFGTDLTPPGSGVPAAPAAAMACLPELAACFGALGGTRDFEAVSASVLPALRAAGAPWTALPPSQAEASRPGQVARSSEHTLLLLSLLGSSHPSGAAQASGKAGERALRAWCQAATAPLVRSLHKGARDFCQLDDAGRHRLRKRLKRLRYALEFGAAVLPIRTTARQLAQLKTVSEALGRYNDLCVAAALFERSLAAEPAAQWALGWLAARRQAEVGRGAEALRRAAKAFAR